MSVLNEDSYDEVNCILREIAYDDGVNYNSASKRILIGSGEDCQIVLFGGNYKELYCDEV